MCVVFVLQAQLLLAVRAHLSSAVGTCIWLNAPASCLNCSSPSANSCLCGSGSIREAFISVSRAQDLAGRAQYGRLTVVSAAAAGSWARQSRLLWSPARTAASGGWTGSCASAFPAPCSFSVVGNDQISTLPIDKMRCCLGPSGDFVAISYFLDGCLHENARKETRFHSPVGY